MKKKFNIDVCLGILAGLNMAAGSGLEGTSEYREALECVQRFAKALQTELLKYRENNPSVTLNKVMDNLSYARLFTLDGIEGNITKEAALDKILEALEDIKNIVEWVD